MAPWDDRQREGNPEANGALPPPPEAAQLQEVMEKARDEVERYVETAADFIRERPVMCVAGALAIGFLVGKIASRR